MKKLKMLLIVAVVVIIAAMSASPADAKKVKDGKRVVNGYVYIFKHGKPRTGHFRYKGKWYYGHKTGSATYPKGSCTAGDMRVEKGNKWYAYGTDGAMIRKDQYVRKGRTRKILQLDIRSKDHTVRYVYGTARGSIGSRYSTKEWRMQYLDDDGEWKTYEGMPYYPPYVDLQK